MCDIHAFHRTAVAVLLVMGLRNPPCDGQELLVSSFFSDQVSRYDLSTGAYLNTFQGGAGLDGVLAARLGPDGLLYVASEGSNEIQRYNVRSGAFIDTFVTSGSGGLAGPTGMTWDAAGDLYVSSFNTDSILKYSGATGQFIQTAVAPQSGGLNGPDNGTLFGPDGLLYVPSYWSNQVLRYDLNAGTSEIFISGIGRPRVFIFHDDGLFYVTSETADAVRRYTLDGQFIDNFIRPGNTILDTPVGLEFYDNFWYVSSLTRDKVLQFDASGTLVNADFIPTQSGGIDGPLFLTAVVVPEPALAGSLGMMLWTLACLGAVRRNRPGSAACWTNL